MSNPVESPFFRLPLEIQCRILENIPADELPTFCLVNKLGFPVVELALEDLWNSLRNSPPVGPINLNRLMKMIKMEEPSELSYLQLFKRLVNVFADAGAKPIGHPLTRADFSELQMQANDTALVAIWPRIHGEHNIFNIDAAQRIRAWINNPNHFHLLRGLTSLNFLSLGLKVLPAEIAHLTQLKCLLIVGNQLEFLPETIGNLTQLQEIYLRNNRLTFLPDAIGNLTQLQKFDLEASRLASLPETIKNLTQLRELSLAFGRFASLPDAIGNLTQLQKFSLRNNQLKSLPEAIGNLKLLQTLDLRNNQLTSLPDAIKNLKEQGSLQLSFEGNPLANSQS